MSFMVYIIFRNSDEAPAPEIDCIVATEEEAIKRTRALNEVFSRTRALNEVFSSEVTLNEDKTDMELTPENIETVNNDLYCYFNYKEYLVDN